MTLIAIGLILSVVPSGVTAFAPSRASPTLLLHHHQHHPYHADGPNTVLFAELLRKTKVSDRRGTTVVPSVPTNLDSFTRDVGITSGIFSFIAPVGGVALLASAAATTATKTSLFNKEWQAMKNDANTMTFAKVKAADKRGGGSSTKAGPIISFDVSALERQDKTIDIAIRASVTFTPCYTDMPSTYNDPKCSLYQDQVKFEISAGKGNQFVLVDEMSKPETNEGTVTYSDKVTWGIGGGFESGKGGGTGGIDASWSVSSSTSYDQTDFDIHKHSISDEQEDKITWASNMKNCYDKTGFSYDIKSPATSLTTFGALTKWLKSPAGFGKADYRLEFLSAFTGGQKALKNKNMFFNFSSFQRLMHVEVLHRFGPSFARTGGIVTGAPYGVKVDGKIMVDLENKKVELKDVVTRGLTFPEFIDDMEVEAKSVAEKRNAPIVAGGMAAGVA